MFKNLSKSLVEKEEINDSVGSAKVGGHLFTFILFLYMPLYIHTYIYIYTHTHIHICAYTHTHSHRYISFFSDIGSHQ
jgi:hypothetical protein